jgi:hypothetical protein
MTTINAQLKEALAAQEEKSEEYELLGQKFTVTGITDNEAVRRLAGSVEAVRNSLDADPVEARGRKVKGKDISDETFTQAALVCAGIVPEPALRIMAVIAKTQPAFNGLYEKVLRLSDERIDEAMDQIEQGMGLDPTDGGASSPASTKQDTIPNTSGKSATKKRG